MNRYSILRKAAALVTVLAFAAGASRGAVLAPAAQAAAPAPGQAAQSRLQIQHEPLACVTTVAAPAVDAFVNPGPDVALSRVHFRVPNTTPYFYYIVMAGTPPSLEGVLPRVEDERVKAVEYFIEAIDRVQLSRQTPGYVAPVIASNVCRAKGIAAPAGGLGLTVGLTDVKQSPAPPGFKKEDIAKVILVGGAVVGFGAAMKTFQETGSTAGASGAGAAAGGAAAGGATAAGTGAAGGGGISTGVLVGVGVAAAAGIGVAVANANKKNSSTPTRTATATPTPTITPVPFQFIEVETSWSGPGDVDIVLLGPGDAPVEGTRVPAGCDTAGSRTERLVVQGMTVASGDYKVKLVGRTCPDGSAGAGEPPGGTITALLSVQVGSSQKCSRFVPVSTTNTQVDGCTFSVP